MFRLSAVLCLFTWKFLIYFENITVLFCSSFYVLFLFLCVKR